LFVWHTSASYYVGCGVIPFSPNQQSTIMGVLYLTAVYCCVYPHPNGNGMIAMAARQMVSAAWRESSCGG